MRPELVIFDCDGVLVDTEGPANTVLAANLTRHGLPMTPEACLDLFVGGTIAGVKKEARRLGARLPDDWVDDVYAEIFARLREGIAVVPGIEAVLDRLDMAGVPYCVGSNGSDAKMDITLGQTGLIDRFRGRIFSAHSVGLEFAKPDPGLYLHAAKAMGVQPAAIAVIEDSASGARAAARAGMRCFGYVPDGHPDKVSAEGATRFASMSELPALLGI